MLGLAIVVNGRSVWRRREPLPAPEELGARITLASRVRFRARRSEPLARRLRYSLLPALGLVLLPKCPLCWAAYVAIVTGGGLATWVPDSRTLGLALAVALAASVAAVGLRARQATDRRPLPLAILGGAVVLLGRFAFGSVVVAALGFVALAAAAVLAAKSLSSTHRKYGDGPDIRRSCSARLQAWSAGSS